MRKKSVRRLNYSFIMTMHVSIICTCNVQLRNFMLLPIIGLLFWRKTNGHGTKPHKNSFSYMIKFQYKTDCYSFKCQFILRISMLRVVKMPPLPQARVKTNTKENSVKAVQTNGVIVLSKSQNQSLSLYSKRCIPQRPLSTKSNQSTKSITSSEVENLLHRGSSRAKSLRQMPNISAKSWVIFQMKQNRCLYGKRNFKRRQIASLTKIMNLITIISLVDKFKLDPSKIKATVTQKISGTTGTTAGLRENEVYTLLDLYYGMMLPSGNDAALMIAAIGGCLIKASNEGISRQKLYQEGQLSQIVTEDQNSAVNGYLREMNRLARQIGMFNTNFANVHGLSNIYSLSTATDVAILCGFAMKNSIFRKIVNTQSHNYVCGFQGKGKVGTQNLEIKQNIDPNVLNMQGSDKKVRKWENTNKLLGQGWSGIKTGITPNAGPCLAASCLKTIAGRQYEFAVILLKSRSMQARWDEAKTLVDWVILTKMYQSSNDY